MPREQLFSLSAADPTTNHILKDNNCFVFMWYSGSFCPERTSKSQGKLVCACFVISVFDRGYTLIYTYTSKCHCDVVVSASPAGASCSSKNVTKTATSVIRLLDALYFHVSCVDFHWSSFFNRLQLGGLQICSPNSPDWQTSGNSQRDISKTLRTAAACPRATLCFRERKQNCFCFYLIFITAEWGKPGLNTLCNTDRNTHRRVEHLGEATATIWQFLQDSSRILSLWPDDIFFCPEVLHREVKSEPKFKI